MKEPFFIVCRDVGSIVKVGVHLGRISGNEKEHFVWGLGAKHSIKCKKVWLVNRVDIVSVSKCKSVRGILGHAPKGNSKLKCIEVTINVYFSIYSCIFKVVKGPQPCYTNKDTLTESLNSGVACTSVPPSFYAYKNKVHLPSHIAQPDLYLFLMKCQLPSI